MCDIFRLDNDGMRPCKLLNDTNRTVGLYLIDLDRTREQNVIQTDSQQYKARNKAIGGLIIALPQLPSPYKFCDDYGHVKRLWKGNKQINKNILYMPPTLLYRECFFSLCQRVYFLFTCIYMYEKYDSKLCL